MPSATTRIVKNTLALYFRQILIMLVSLYTVRVVLETLGAEDYGIYNVVAGVVTTISFLSNSLAGASQRYFSFELGRGDFEQLSKIFNLNLIIYVLLGAVVLLVAETVGLWFVSNNLVVPEGRRNAALLVYQFAVVSFIFSIVISPYMAVIIAHEDMNIYAYISIIDVLLRLVLVFILGLINWDKLVVYGMLLCGVGLINVIIYKIICTIKYNECRFNFYWNKKLFFELLGYTSFNMFGSIAAAIKNQGITILLNQFFSPVIVAARSISLTVNNAVSSFSGNFYNAVRPQIIKNYAVDKKAEMLSIVFHSAKATYFLMYVFILPLMLELPLVFAIWLDNPPPFSVLFTRLMLLEMLINAVTMPLGAVVHATGKIKLYQSVYYGVSLLNLPLSWIALYNSMLPYSVMIISIILAFIDFILVLFIVKRLIDFSITWFFKDVIFPMIIITVLSAILPVGIYILLSQGFTRFCMIAFTSIISVCVYMYFLGLNKEERNILIYLIRDKFFKK